MLKVHSRKFGEVVILCLQGRLVKGDTAALREAVESQSHVNAILLDLTRVSTVDAGGLGILLELRAQTLSRGTRFKLMNVTGFVRRVFQISRLDSVFEISSAEEVLPLASNERRLSREHLLACA